MAAGTDRGWAAITLDTWLLGAEAWLVVGLRTARLARGGPGACSEARLMVSEKIDASMELSAALLAGQLGATPRAVVGNVVSHYLAGVRANRRRLARG